MRTTLWKEFSYVFLRPYRLSAEYENQTEYFVSKNKKTVIFAAVFQPQVFYLLVLFKIFKKYVFKNSD